MTEIEIKEKLRGKQSPKLYRHSIAVAEMSIRLAKIYRIDEKQALLAGLLHDYAKEMPKKELIVYAKSRNIAIDFVQQKQPGLLHGIVSAHIAKIEFEINDTEILHAIEIHSTGSTNMSLLDKILYISDSAEPDRDYDGVEMIRDLVFNSELDSALLVAMKIKLIYVIEKKIMLHPDSIGAWNELVNRAKN